MKKGKNRPIGIFDSGVGGLTVARSIRKLLPEEDIIYFGDTARVPYGNKSRATITRFVHEIMKFMVSKNVKMVVVACNTASSLSLNVLKRSYDIPIIGVIKPGAKEALRISKKKRVGVIGTNSTISSGSYLREINRIDSSYKVFQKDCPLFVPLVENRFINDNITLDVAKKYLSGLKKKNIDALILGCTHYPILKSVLNKVMTGTNLVDSSSSVAKEVKDQIEQRGFRASRRKQGKMKCFVSDDAVGFYKMSKIFLKEKVPVKKVIL